jgi:Cof subfamily protein (haloacid dehalogenase superfamily)
MTKKLIAIDLDGTLFYPKKRIRLVSKPNIRFLHKAISLGHEVVFVTSRNRAFVEKVLKEIKLDIDFICRNGSVIVYQKQVIHDAVMNHEDVENVFRYVQQKHQRFMTSIDTQSLSNLVYTSAYVWYLSYMYKFYYFLQGRYREDYLQDNLLFQKKIAEATDIQRMLLYFGLGKKAKALALEEAEALRLAFPRLEIAWISGLIEIAAIGTNKGNALKKLVATKGIAPQDVIVIGDSGNDISMFHAFSNSYCMAHAHPEVKKHARHVIDRVHHLGKIIFETI